MLTCRHIRQMGAQEQGISRVRNFPTIVSLIVIIVTVLSILPASTKCESREEINGNSNNKNDFRSNNPLGGINRSFFHYDFGRKTRREISESIIRDLIIHPSRTRPTAERKKLLYALENRVTAGPHPASEQFREPYRIVPTHLFRRSDLFEVIIPERRSYAAQKNFLLPRGSPRIPTGTRKRSRKYKSKSNKVSSRNQQQEQQNRQGGQFLTVQSGADVADVGQTTTETISDFFEFVDNLEADLGKFSTLGLKQLEDKIMPPQRFIKEDPTTKVTSESSTSNFPVTTTLDRFDEQMRIFLTSSHAYVTKSPQEVTGMSPHQQPGNNNNNYKAANPTLATYTTQTLFRERTDGYRMFRIPTIVSTKTGAVLVFCEGRRYAVHDHGSIDIVYRRSVDGGKVWEPMRVLINGKGEALGNPAPVVDRKNGVIVLVFCRSKAWATEPMIRTGEASHRTVWVTRSIDDGMTWFKPKEITKSVRQEDWSWYATGPVHGIQLKSGRLVVPCNHVVGFKRTGGWKDRSHVIFSDDAGISWKLGGMSRYGTNEATIVQVGNGSLYLNSRNMLLKKQRIGAWSHDDGVTFQNGKFEDSLIEPDGHGCQGSLLRLSVNGKKVILFSNPSTRQRKRENVSISISFDDCNSWESARTIYAGSSAYTDMVGLKDGIVGLIYERGFNHPYQSIAFDTFNLDWLFEMRIANKLT